MDFKIFYIEDYANDFINVQIDNYCNDYISEYSIKQTNEKFIDLKDDYIYDNIFTILHFFKSILSKFNIDIKENIGYLKLISNFYFDNNYSIKNKYKNEKNQITCILVTEKNSSLDTHYIEY